MYEGNTNVLITEKMALLDTLNPASRAAANTTSSAWLPAKDYAQFAALLALGAMTATGVLNAKLEQATDVAGTGAKDITGKAVTALTAAGTDDNKQAFINLRPEELDIANDFNHFRLTVAVTTAAVIYNAHILGMGPRYGTVTHNTTVDEIIA
jgi:hypothetical protein